MNIERMRNKMHITKNVKNDDAFAWCITGYPGLIFEYFDNNDKPFYMVDGIDDKLTLTEAIEEIALRCA